MREPTCFLSLITLKRSKSLSSLRLLLRSRFCAQALLSQVFSTPAFSQAALRGPLLMARGSLSMTMGVRETWARGEEWRGTTASGFEEGPSTRICFYHTVSRCLFRLSCPLVHSAASASFGEGLPSTYALVVDDFDNGSEPAGVGAGAEEDDTADLDVPPLASVDLGRHFEGSLCRKGSFCGDLSDPKVDVIQYLCALLTRWEDTDSRELGWLSS